MKPNKRASQGKPTRQIPTAGIWWWLWLADRWELMVFPDPPYHDVGHPRMWREHVAPRLAEHYRVDVRKIEDQYAGMPRGRMCLRGDVYVFYHGNDTPIDFGTAEKLLPSRFGLHIAACQGRVKMMPDTHESMLDDDKEILQGILKTTIPYPESRGEEQ